MLNIAILCSSIKSNYSLFNLLYEFFSKKFQFLLKKMKLTDKYADILISIAHYILATNGFILHESNARMN